MDSKNDTYKRDNLAVLRTQWANERTMLAYVRTALSAFILSLALLHFVEGASSNILGLFALLVGIFFLIVGAVTYIRHKKRDIEKFR